MYYSSYIIPLLCGRLMLFIWNRYQHWQNCCVLQML